MDDILETKTAIRNEVAKKLSELSADRIRQITGQVAKRLFEFANFMEANIALLYINKANEVSTKDIITRCYDFRKTVVLPSFNNTKHLIKLFKVVNPLTDLILGTRGVLEPDSDRCKIMPIEMVDIAIIPGFAFDEKGGRIGSGDGYYDRLIPRLAPTTRKVALAFELQIMQQVPMTSHDRHVDIIITESRIIYKI